MAKWYYYVRGGEQVGPVSTEEMKSLAKQGVISKDTIIENERSIKRSAGSVAGLEFGIEPYKISEDLSSRFAQPDSTQPVFVLPGNFPDLPPLAESLMDAPQFPPPPQSSPVNLPPNSVYVPQREKPFLRFIYIFLAVFVGIFGIHDFYAKRNRAGWIHLWLLSPYLIPFICSILAVPIWTIYTVCYSPHLLEIVQCKSEIADTNTKIANVQQQLEETRNKFHDAVDCKFKIPQPKEQPEPQPSKQRKPQWTQDAEQPGTVPVWEEDKQPQKEDCMPDDYTIKVLKKQGQDLTQQLLSLNDRLDSLKNKLSELEADKNLETSYNWIVTGELWIYFIFVLLPFFSWVMAMYEIITVTTDGRGIELA